MDRLGGGAAHDAHVSVAKFDSQGGLGDEHGDCLVLVDAAEGDFLPDDHDHAGSSRCSTTDKTTSANPGLPEPTPRRNVAPG
jgi:hypothetical protein